MNRWRESKWATNSGSADKAMNYSKDYYAILGVHPSATAKEIRHAYLRLALMWHPDRHVGAGTEELAMAEAWFKEIGEAYSVLSDPRLRSEYDFFRSRQVRAAASAKPRPAPPRPRASSSGAAGRKSSVGSGAGRSYTDSSYARGHNWGSPYGTTDRTRYGQTSSRNGTPWKDWIRNAVFGAFLAAAAFSWWQAPIDHIYESTKEAIGKFSVYVPRESSEEAPKTFQDVLMEDLSFATLRMKQVQMPDSTWFAIHKSMMK